MPLNEEDDGLALARATPVVLATGEGIQCAGSVHDVTVRGMDGIVASPRTETRQESKSFAPPMEVDDGKDRSDGEAVVEGSAVKGEIQPDAFRDAWAAVLFLFQAVAVAGIAVSCAPYIAAAAAAANENGTERAGASSSFSENEATNDLISDEDQDDDGASFLLLLFLAYTIAGITTMSALSLMMRYPEALVKVSFFFAPISFAAVSILCWIAGDDVSAYFAGWSVFVSILMLLFYYFYKHHIPFAAANLQAALTALRLNAATYGIAFLFSFLSFVAVITFVVAIAGLQSKAQLEGQSLCSELHKDDDTMVFEEGEMCDTHPPNPVLIFFLLFGFYWTLQVIQNVLHVTTAGVVGSWWFDPMGDPSCCSRTLASSIRRATTYSFGSVCFGSLLVAILQVLERMVRNNRRDGGGGLVTCVLQCLLQCLRGYLEYFNSWAFVYVGLYGYPYVEAGKNVMTLFRQRGWTTLISDRLVFRVLVFCNLGVGAVCGCFAILCEVVIGPFFPSMEVPLLTAFFVAFLIGITISNTALFVVESAVRTVIVCFAENAPAFADHHPELSEILMAGYAEAYPNIPVVAGILA